MSLTRLDIKYAVLKPVPTAVLKPVPTAAQAVGLHLCTAERNSADGLVVQRSAIRSDSEVVAQTGYTDIQEATLVTVLEPSIPYILVRSQAPNMIATVWDQSSSNKLRECCHLCVVYSNICWVSRQTSAGDGGTLALVPTPS